MQVLLNLCLVQVTNPRITRQLLDSPYADCMSVVTGYWPVGRNPHNSCHNVLIVMDNFCDVHQTLQTHVISGRYVKRS